MSTNQLNNGTLDILRHTIVEYVMGKVWMQMIMISFPCFIRIRIHADENNMLVVLFMVDTVNTQSRGKVEEVGLEEKVALNDDDGVRSHALLALA